MKWGDKFPALYVNRLYSMVLKNTTIPFRFICFTDNSTDIHPDVEIQALPELHIPNGLPERGWRKLTVFAENFGNLSGTTLFLDLDIVIVDSIDEFFTYPGDFLIAHDKHRPARLEGNSSVFRFEIGQHPEILSYFIENFSQIRQEVRHEQAYLSREIKKTSRLNFWPDEWVPSFKYRCAPSWIKSWFQAPSIPDGAKIILFHGLPNPPEAIKGISGKWHRHIKPSPWIKDYWKEEC
ncbi:MAG: hypothetical protein PSN04_09150 [Methyloprofundus sp.]|nr:hypothetical protein [Methyloprofundus sp.]